MSRDEIRRELAEAILAWLSAQGWIQPPMPGNWVPRGLGDPPRRRPNYQAMAAEWLGWNRPQVSDLLHGKLHRLGVRRLRLACAQISKQSRHA